MLFDISFFSLNLILFWVSRYNGYKFFLSYTTKRFVTETLKRKHFIGYVYCMSCTSSNLNLQDDPFHNLMSSGNSHSWIYRELFILSSTELKSCGDGSVCFTRSAIKDLFINSSNLCFWFIYTNEFIANILLNV